MKNIVLKFYMTAFFLCSTLITFAQPGSDDSGGGLEGGDPPAAPIDDFVWILAGIALVYVFSKLRTFALQEKSAVE